MIGLKRTGKSCRLRWVNYLHPGLKRGKMTPHEEKLVLELHSQWGNRWSRIARRLPGRTDNEIKNYWRTHMRKKAQEKKQETSPSSSSSTSTTSNSFSSSNIRAVNSKIATETTESFDSTVPDISALQGKKYQKDESEEEEYYSMDDIWKDITSEEPIKPVSVATVTDLQWLLLYGNIAQTRYGEWREMKVRCFSPLVISLLLLTNMRICL